MDITYFDVVRNSGVPHFETPMGIGSVELMARRAVQLGAGVPQVLQASKIAPRSLTDMAAAITPNQEFVVIRNLVRTFRSKPGIGVDIGSRYHAAMHGSLGAAMLTSPNLAHSLQVIADNLHLVWGFMPFDVVERGDSTVFRMSADDVPDDARAFMVERNAAAARSMMSDAAGFDVPLTAVRFRHRVPAGDLSTYVDILGVEPIFGAVEDSIAFATRYAGMPARQANSAAHQGFVVLCRDLAKRQVTRAGVAGQVRALLSRDLQTGGGSAAAVAAHLGVSERTLARRLDEEGTSFRALVDEVRQHVAKHLLTGGMATTQVARKLGYADSPAFIRAFKRWTGVTPQSFAPAAA
ncbi:MAG: helix-turn-helix domain-containing protein [Mycobacteriaceae bacterium]|nr:helix-turn-helix domain-containing protein [Mycobacteriaceae bacterium]